MNEVNKETVNNNETKEDNKESVLNRRVFAGINVEDMPKKEEAAQIDTRYFRTMKMSQVFANEILNNVFKPLGITEDNKLIETLDDDDDMVMLKWDTRWLSEFDQNSEIEEEIKLGNEETIRANSIIECILYGRQMDGLLAGVKDANGAKLPVMDETNPIIAASFEMIVDANQADIEKGYNLYKDTLKMTDDELDDVLFISSRPTSADPTGVSQQRISILAIGLSQEQMKNMSSAFRTAAFGKKVNSAIKKSNTTIYGGAKMLGNDILIPGAEVFGATMGSLAGSTAQAACVALSEGANEFTKSFNLKSIKDRPSTRELYSKIFRNRSNTSRGGRL